MVSKNAVLIIAVALMLSGCGGTIYKKFSIDTSPATSLSVDARQRVILVTDKGTKTHDQRVVCAEPSPDVLVATAAAAAAKVGAGNKSVGLSGSLAETAAVINPRTQTIQLLRDGLYRACEAYLNGAIDWREYKRIVGGYDQATITLLAIDGMTQSMTTRQVIIGTKSSAKKDESAESSAESTSPSGGIEQKKELQAKVAEKLAPVIKEILQNYYEHQVMMAEKQTKLTEAYKELTEERAKLAQEKREFAKIQTRFKEMELQLEELKTAKKPKSRKKKKKLVGTSD